MSASIRGEEKSRVTFKWVALLVAMVLAVSACAACDGTAPNEGDAGQSLAATGEAAQQATTLTIEVQAPEWTQTDGSVSVSLEGKTAENMPFAHTYSVIPNKKKELNVDPGSYQVSIRTKDLDTETVLWKATSQKVVLAEGDSTEIVLELAHDAEAMEKAAKEAEEKARAEAEAQAQREAEAQAQREAEAAASAAAAQAAEAQASQKSTASGGGGGSSASAPAASSGGGTVYVASSGNGTKYHSNPNCSNMNGTRQLSVSEAQAQGYTPCKKCY